jgi:hypothetical protein
MRCASVGVQCRLEVIPIYSFIPGFRCPPQSKGMREGLSHSLSLSLSLYLSLSFDDNNKNAFLTKMEEKKRKLALM